MGQWAERSLNRDKIAAMIDLAKSDPRLAITTAKIDCNPWLLNFENGTVDLRTGELSKHRREDYITKIVRCKYTPDLSGPRWLLFLDQMFGDLADWVQKAVGYSLTGITSEKVVFLLLGLTDTGKTTFLSTLKTIFANYSSLLQIDTLMWSKSQDNNASADLADLRGARFVMTSETKDNGCVKQNLNASRKAWVISKRPASMKTRSPSPRLTNFGLTQISHRRFAAVMTRYGKDSCLSLATIRWQKKTLNLPTSFCLKLKQSPVGSSPVQFVFITKG
jgi:hypothetical protein